MKYQLTMSTDGFATAINLHREDGTILDIYTLRVQL